MVTAQPELSTARLFRGAQPGSLYQLFLLAYVVCVCAQERGDVMTCLVTGNLEPVGWGKMQALGIDHLFTKPR